MGGVLATTHPSWASSVRRPQAQVCRMHDGRHLSRRRQTGDRTDDEATICETTSCETTGGEEIIRRSVGELVGAHESALGHSQSAFGLVDRRHQIVVLGEVAASKCINPVAIAIGAFGHDGEFGRDGGQIG